MEGREEGRWEDGGANVQGRKGKEEGEVHLVFQPCQLNFLFLKENNQAKFILMCV